MNSLRYKQLEMLKIIKRIDEICQKNGIKYCLAYGTTLGAVRHKGFIPWDDDADIYMGVVDYKKFEKIWKEKYADDQTFFLQNYKTDNKYPMLLPKIRNTKIDVNEKYFENMDVKEGLWVDIFVLAYLSNNRVVRFMQEKSRAVANFLAHKYFYISKNDYVMENHNHVGIKAFLFRLLPEILRKILIRLFLRLSYSSKSTNYNKGLMDDINYSCDYLKEVEYTDFEDIKLPIPKEYDKYLKERYGDYMTPVKYQHDTI